MPHAVRLHPGVLGAADVITVPSRQAADSFLERGWLADRLFVNSYGVDVDMFRFTPAPAWGRPTVICGGSWSYQKGCDA